MITRIFKKYQIPVLTGLLLLVLSQKAYTASEKFVNDCRALTKFSHRLTGTGEYKQAADYIVKSLNNIGVDRTIVQRFNTAQTKVKKCEIQINSRKLLLTPVRPNGIIPSVTPEEGITGPLLYAGFGDLDDYKNRSPKGCIVILNYNSERAWLRAFRLGAKAVIFVRKGECRAYHSHYVEANANFPRFYYNASIQDLPDGQTATIHSEVVWATVPGYNIFAFFKGKNPKFFLDKQELIVIAANLDSFGEVPRISPGARGGVNCAGLLKLAEYFKVNRPDRHIMLAFFDAQARGHAGSSAFCKAFDQTDMLIDIPVRQKYIDNEKRFLTSLQELLNKPDPLNQKSDLSRELIIRLKIQSAEHAYGLGALLYDLREEAIDIKNKDKEKYNQLQEIIRENGLLKDQWNELRRGIVKNQIPEEVNDKYIQTINDIKNDVMVRLGELEFEQDAIDSDKAVRKLIGNFWISLHISLMLGDTSSWWGVIIGGDSDLYTGQPGLYGKIQNVFLSSYRSVKKKYSSPLHFEYGSVDGSLNPPRLLWAAPHLIHSGEMIDKLGIYNIVLGTSQENLAREGTPDDRLEKLNLDRIEKQVSEISILLHSVANSKGLSLRRAIVPNKIYFEPEFGTDNHVRGPIVMGTSHGSFVPNKPMSDTTIQLRLNERIHSDPPPKKIYAYDNFQVLRVNQNGSYAIGPVQKDKKDGGVSERFGFAVHTDERGVVTWASTLELLKKVDTRLNMVECNHGAAILPPLLSLKLSQEIRVFDAVANSRLEEDESYFDTVDGVVYWYCEERIKRIKLFESKSLVKLITKGKFSEEYKGRFDESGIGFSIERAEEPVGMADIAAADLWHLDESRLEILRSRGIMNTSIEELHSRSEDLLLESRRNNAMSKKNAMASSSFLGESTVYDKIRFTFDDLVRAVLILLAIAVPFAFALERLLVGAPTIHKQITWFVLFFLATFMILFFSHPAFTISKTPIVIFLGFAIVVLSALVIVIIMRKFEVELKEMQGMRSTVHSTDVSRLNTMVAAMKMGISTMRRRPLRTALTTVTIVLLTFTILCFASFGTKTGIVKLFTGPTTKYTGVLMHQINWAELNPDVLDVIKGRWGDRTRINLRYWLSKEHGPIVTRQDGSSPVTLRGVLGLNADEIKLRADFSEIIDMSSTRDFHQTVWMTKAVADLLNVKPGDKVLVAGLVLKIGNLLDSSKISIMEDMDDSSILPVDFTAMKDMMNVEMDEETLGIQRQENWATLPVDSVVIVSCNAAKRMGAALHAITLYTEDVSQSISIAEDIARILKIPISATRSDGVYYHVLGPIIQASGAKDLFFPILLGGLVIFGTMLGSVADREKEIYTFSALGLAPPHISSLFFAEALVYSVIGGLGGYLVAQGSMKILSFLAEYGILSVPEMNYSSTNAVVTLLIVMGTVLVSSIYPAMKASRSANPGILHSWQLPSPEGDVFNIVFPFTVSGYDLTGIVGFLKEHFNNFTDTGLGIFIAGDTQLVYGKDKSLGLDTNLALAPFDLGVTQSFELRSIPSEIPGIDEVKIKITRKSGQPKDWQRLNKVLLSDLRKQFLIWRSLASESMEIYRHQILSEIGIKDKKKKKG